MVNFYMPDHVVIKDLMRSRKDPYFRVCHTMLLLHITCACMEDANI